MEILSQYDFEQDLTLLPDDPYLVNYGISSPPLLCRCSDADEFEIMHYICGSWERVHTYPLYSQNQWALDYTDKHGLALIRRMYDKNAYNYSVVEHLYLDCNWVEKRHISTNYFLFCGYIDNDKYLCLEQAHGNLVCRGFDGTPYWKTNEIFQLSRAHKFNVLTNDTVKPGEIYIIDADMCRMYLYTVDGFRIGTFRIPIGLNICNPYQPKIVKTGHNNYYIEGFIDGLEHYGKVELGPDKPAIESYFHIGIEDGIVQANDCKKNENNFLLTSIGLNNNKTGNSLHLVSKQGGKYVAKCIHFIRKSDRHVGGGTTQWVDGTHFLYIESSGLVKYCDTSGKSYGCIHMKGEFIRGDPVITGDLVYLLTRREPENKDSLTYAYCVYVIRL